MKHSALLLDFLLLCLLSSLIFSPASILYSAESNADEFFRDGQTRWTVQPLQPDDPTVLQAQQEFQRALKQISGASFETRGADSSGGSQTVYIGVDPTLTATPDLIQIETRDGNLYLTGGSERSALYAVYDFLQKELGVRWLWPGDDGEFFPQRQAWNLPLVKRAFTPPIKYRGFHMCGDWYRVDEFHLWMSRNMLNAHRHGNYRFPDRSRGFYRIYSNHNVYPPQELFAAHPEYFALRNGKRLACQVCLSNQDGLRATADKLALELEKAPDIDIISLFLPDNQEYCQCEQCSKKTISTAFFDFYNDLTDLLKERFPHLKFATLAYQGYLDPPDNPVRNAEFVEIATHNRCNIHLYEDPACSRNGKELDRWNRWRETGTPLGNYAYEYDLFGSDLLFIPFFRVISDAVQVNKKLNSVIVLPEVCLSPRKGPEERVGTYSNRISQYLMARLMVDPSADWKELLKDYCDYAFGPASEPIYEYLLAMDKQWSAMDAHRGILGSPAGLAEKLITPEIRLLAESKFADAKSRLAETATANTNNTKDGSSTEKTTDQLARYYAAVKRETVLFGFWLRYLEDGSRLEIPLVTDAQASDAGTTIPGLSARICWTNDGLTIKDFKTPLELAVTTGFGGETEFFRVSANGETSQWRVSDVGVRDESWNPNWSAVNGAISIPFTVLSDTPPTPKTLWQFRIEEANQSYPKSLKGTDSGSVSSNDSGSHSDPNRFAGLSFSSSPKTGRALAFWTGSRERDKASFPSMSMNFREYGWNLTIASTPDEFLALQPEAYFLKNPQFQEKLTPECWEKVRRDVEGGKLAIFLSYSSLPLDKYFNDPSWSVEVRGIKGPISLSERRTNYYLDDSWFKSPHNLLPPLQNEITPAYCLVLSAPDKWRVLATMPQSAAEPNERLVYIALRSYGKGAVLLLSADPRIPLAKLFDNITEFVKTSGR